jgi:hypothetical protein
MENSKSRFWQISLLVGVVVVMPVVSVIINLKGAEKGITFYKTLKNNYGKIPQLNSLTWFNDSINSEKMKGKVMIVSFITPENRDTIMNVLNPIIKTDQFREEVDNLTFLTFDVKEDSLYSVNYLKGMNGGDRRLMKILRGGNDILPAFKLPNEFSVVLVDTAGDMRCYYDTRKYEDKRLLVEHISVMPIKMDKKPIKRDQKQF